MPRATSGRTFVSSAEKLERQIGATRGGERRAGDHHLRAMIASHGVDRDPHGCEGLSGACTKVTTATHERRLSWTSAAKGDGSGCSGGKAASEKLTPGFLG